MMNANVNECEGYLDHQEGIDLKRIFLLGFAS